MGVLGGGAGPKSVLLELVQGVREVGDLRDGQVHHGAGARLVGAHAHAGGSGTGHDDARRAHDLGRAHDGAEVSLVGDVVEHDDEGWPLPRTLEDVVELGVAIGTHAQHHALVGAVARE